jgi:hypothetical protein
MENKEATTQVKDLVPGDVFITPAFGYPFRVTGEPVRTDGSDGWSPGWKVPGGHATDPNAGGCGYLRIKAGEVVTVEV